MLNKTVVDKIRELVEPIAARDCPPLDESEFMVCDYAGGNIDDAYEIGQDAGEVSMARQVVILLNKGE